MPRTSQPNRQNPPAAIVHRSDEFYVAEAGIQPLKQLLKHLDLRSAEKSGEFILSG